MGWLFDGRKVEYRSRSGETMVGEVDRINPVKAGVWILFAVLLIVMLSVGGCAGCKAFNRAQRRSDANNQVRITSIHIRNAQQQARVTAAQNQIVKQQAQQRYLTAVGIRRAQDEISKTLTPLYVQWEAIQAQFKLASSPTHTQTYIPSGANGVPLVATTPPPTTGR